MRVATKIQPNIARSFEHVVESYLAKLRMKFKIKRNISTDFKNYLHLKVPSILVCQSSIKLNHREILSQSTMHLIWTAAMKDLTFLACMVAIQIVS
jgi:hypothetical protein